MQPLVKKQVLKMVFGFLPPHTHKIPAQPPTPNTPQPIPSTSSHPHRECLDEACSRWSNGRGHVVEYEATR